MAEGSNLADCVLRERPSLDRPPSCVRPVVDVWVCDLRTDDSVDEWSTSLSAVERRRLDAFVHARDRVRFAVSHSLARVVLSAYLGTEPGNVCLRSGAKGKPYVCDRSGAPSPWSFNLSHCEDRALVAVAHDRPIGVDIERERDDVDVAALVRQFFGPAEREQFASLPTDRRHAWFHRQWVAREAVVKAHGGGWSIPPESFTVLFEEGGTAAVHSPDASPGGQWVVRTVDVGAGWHAAVASSGRAWQTAIISPAADLRP
jgi:4'-phosphopantetheinyl transferase